jgi:hypothetical protein
VARSLNDTHRETAAQLRTQVDAATRDTDPDDDNRPHWTLVAAPQDLRGIPAIGSLSGSSAIYGTQPGFGLFDE